jgi:hypothetical protein
MWRSRIPRCATARALALHGPGGDREGRAVVDADRLIGIAQLHDRHGAQGLEHVRQVVLTGLVLVRQPGQRIEQGPALEAVDADVELDRPALLVGGILALDDLLKAAGTVADDAAVVAPGVFDRGDGGLSAGPAVLVDHRPDGIRREQRGIAVDHEHVGVLQVLSRHLLDGITGAERLALVDHLGPLVEVGRHLGMVRAHDGLDVADAGSRDRVHDPVDHGPATDRMEHLRGA